MPKNRNKFRLLTNYTQKRNIHSHDHSSVGRYICLIYAPLAIILSLVLVHYVCVCVCVCVDQYPSLKQSLETWKYYTFVLKFIVWLTILHLYLFLALLFVYFVPKRYFFIIRTSHRYQMYLFGYRSGNNTFSRVVDAW